MMRSAQDSLERAAAFLRENRSALPLKKIMSGFDGCCDSIMRVYKNANGNDVTGYFRDMREFGEYIASKNDMSCSIELEECSEKIGGNAPIFANSMSKLGMPTCLFGTLGKPDIHHVFAKLGDLCDIYSYAKNNFAISLEFNDGKVILAPKHKVDHVWDTLKASIEFDVLLKCMVQADIAMLANWSELDYAQELWIRVLEEIYLEQPCDKTKNIMIDLADCSRRSEQEILEMTELLKRFSTRRRVTLGLNENEAKVLYIQHIGCSASCGIEELICDLFARMGVDNLVIHTNYEAIAFDGKQQVRQKTLRVDSPHTLTGGGDHFNAGFSLGLVLKGDLELCCTLGNAVSSYYVANGNAPGMDDLLEHLKQWRNSLL